MERLVTVSVIRERRESHGCASDIADFTVDASLVIPAGTLLEGEKAIEAIYQGAFGRGYAGNHASATFRRDAQLRDEVAMLDGEWTMTDVLDATATSGATSAVSSLL